MNALIIEGGGMRGIFSVGVLDAFLRHKYDPFDMYIGVSSGACNIPSHIAGQFRRNFDSYTGHMASKHFLNFSRFLRGGHYMDLDWLWNSTQEENPIHFEKAYQVMQEKHKRFYVVATNAQSGKPVYLSPTPANWLDCLKSSSALPLYYRKGCVINNERLVDGVLSDPLPVKFAHEQGARNIVVIRSQKYPYARKADNKTKLFSLLLLKYPQVRKQLLNYHHTYNTAVDFLGKSSQPFTLQQILPGKSMKTSQVTQDINILKNDYEMGYAAGEAFIAQH
ncbi:patatin-like phospholipase family protein [Chitinophaga nivalis]|uniref:Patatin family protein n=1 Tax=Chitinophaga nivalis TaxID=2991709 RepID=A0ABT3IMS2_9BACT|nr:patatin family protein [Chitinophaga nivalis]MCW3465036.1 patatin family protein [Chitinophaga nivalis]MCW3485272.1 patatin family protein [Chitinophaga nivalis]